MILPALRQRWLKCPNQLFFSFHPNISILTPSHHLPSANHNHETNRKTPQDHLHDHLLHPYLMFTPAWSRSFPSISSIVRSGAKRHYSFFILVYNSSPMYIAKNPVSFFLPFMCACHIRVPIGPWPPFSLASSSNSFRPCSIFARFIFPNCAVPLTEDPFHGMIRLVMFSNDTRQDEKQWTSHVMINPGTCPGGQIYELSILCLSLIQWTILLIFMV